MKRRNFVKGTLSTLALINLLPGELAGKDKLLYDHQLKKSGLDEPLIIDPGIKIIRIETFSRPEVAVVKITTNNGETGWGQISGILPIMFLEKTCQILIRLWIAALKGT